MAGRTLHSDSNPLVQLTTQSDVERRLRQLDLLQRLTESVNRAEDPDRICQEAIDGLLAALDADRAAVLLLEGDTMRYKAWRELSDRYRRVMAPHSPWERDTRSPRPILVRDTFDDASVAPYREVLDAEGIRALLLVPLIDAGELLGRVVLYWNAPHAPDPEDVRLAESIARHVALAIARRRSWAALSSSESTFAALAEQSPDLIARFDRQYRHLYVNRTVEEVTGRSRREFLGRSNRELGMTAELLETWEPALERVFTTGHGDVIGFEYRTAEGVRYFESRLVPERLPGGEVVSVLSTTRDLTERREVENRLRFLLEAGTALASSLDFRTTLDAVARIGGESFGDACAIDVLGEGGRIERLAIHAHDTRLATLFAEMELRYPEDLTGTAGNVVALRTGEPQLYSPITEELMRAASRDEGHLELWRRLALTSAMCVPLIARERRLGVITVVSADPRRLYSRADLDVLLELARRAATAVDHAMLFEETRTARDEAQRANAAKASFLAVMSHELRTPLAAILGYAELVADEIVGPVNEVQRDQIERIKSSGTHLLMLIEELLSFARIDVGHESLRVMELDVREVVHEATAVVEPLVRKKQLALDVRLPVEPLHISTDPQKVRQILLNLLGNAIKFTDRGSVRVELLRSGDHVEIAVEDTGIGIPAEHLEHVFDAFWQVEHVTTRRKGGTGLGLSVARQLARLLGGDILVRSELERGSRFTLRLPHVVTATTQA